MNVARPKLLWVWDRRFSWLGKGKDHTDGRQDLNRFAAQQVRPVDPLTHGLEGSLLQQDWTADHVKIL